MIPQAVDKEVDCIGMICPLPVLRTKKALAEMQSGQILKVTATDPGSEHDLPMFAKQTGNELIATETDDELFVFYLRRR
mgnify:CR=1